MRSYYIISFLCLSCLTSCVNYSGIHSHAKPVNESMLTKSYGAGAHSKFISIKSDDWWTIYHDPQLNRLINTALVDSPTMQIAASRMQTARHSAEEVGANLWPSLNAYGTIQRERLTENTFFPPPYGGNNYTETNVGLSFNYELDFWGKNQALLASKIDTARAAEANVAAARLLLASAIASYYFQLQYDLATLKLNTEILWQRKELYNITLDRAKHNIASDLPVTTALAQVQSSRIVVEALKQKAQATTYQLAALMGKNPLTTAITPAPFSHHQNVLNLPKVIPANLLARRPDIIVSRWYAESAAAQIKVAKALFYPNFNLMALFSYQSFILSKTFTAGSRDSYGGVAIDLPIFDAGRRRANLALRDSEFDTAVAQYNQAILTALREVANQVTTLQSLRAQVLAQTDALGAIEKNYALTRSRYQHGIIDYMKVLEAKTNWLSAQNQQVQLQAQQLTASVAMIKALGGNYVTLEGTHG